MPEEEMVALKLEIIRKIIETDDLNILKKIEAILEGIH